MDILGLVFPLWWVLLEIDVLRERLEGLFQLVGELLKVGRELLLLFFLAFTPVIVSKLVNKWLEDLVDDGVQGVNGVFTDLTEKNSAVVLVGFVDLFSLVVSEEIAPLAAKFDLLTVGDKELLRTVEVLDIS